ncbi:protein rep [Paenibacillus apiarius]|uniref:Protein rep n=1 Tax=Paenibacillus apiarius TaxID=46240 RepID=A0ABT4DT79_9BACL|nr:protein rep [Paenibacillus apiarius]MCY9513840.1 protein rep [Paenibacillus apiarius]MCY9520460.1 protein rep [Paenibacillus apiarius]MCY9550593.1 protein rep [Paenibacillus apiarius]MCY9559114.1 protein rep [Paenibacillus apiarius]MCY9683091.1 protein rep [Paenibacillus apiarius]
MLVSWKRSLQLAYYNHCMIAKVNKEKQVNWLIVELGMEHVAEERINQELDNMLIGFNRLFKYKSIKQATLGYFRMLDIVKRGDEYYPRIHILIPAIKSYFQGRYYIKYDNWLSMWSKALDIENNLFVKVKAVNSKCDAAAVMMKMKKGLSLLHEAAESKNTAKKSTPIASRRLIGYSRLLKDEMDQIGFDNGFAPEMDALHTEDSIANRAFDRMLEWHPGLRSEASNPFFSSNNPL